MDNLKMEDLVEKDVDSTSENTQKVETKTEEKVEESTETTEVTTEQQNLLKAELETLQKKETRTELEKAAYSLKKNADRLKELGGDPNTILGIEKETTETDEDDTPVTLGMLKKLQQETASKNASQLADEISNETERELVKYHLSNTIKSTGNPTEDLKLARSLVNAVKNTKIMEEVNRKSEAKNHSNASSAGLKTDDSLKGELTAQEKIFLGKPFLMTKEEILKLRDK